MYAQYKDTMWKTQMQQHVKICLHRTKMTEKEKKKEEEACNWSLSEAKGAHRLALFFATWSLVWFWHLTLYIDQTWYLIFDTRYFTPTKQREQHKVELVWGQKSTQSLLRWVSESCLDGGKGARQLALWSSIWFSPNIFSLRKMFK